MKYEWFKCRKCSNPLNSTYLISLLLLLPYWSTSSSSSAWLSSSPSPRPISVWWRLVLLPCVHRCDLCRTCHCHLLTHRCSSCLQRFFSANFIFQSFHFSNLSYISKFAVEASSSKLLQPLWVKLEHLRTSYQVSMSLMAPNWLTKKLFVT